MQSTNKGLSMSLLTKFKSNDEKFNFHQVEEEIRAKHIKESDEEIKGEIQELFSNKEFMQWLKESAASKAYKFEGFRDINLRLASGNSIKISSPFFVKSKTKAKRGPRKNRKNSTSHLGLEYLGFIKNKSALLVSIASQMAIISPSFDIAVQVLKNLNINLNHTFLQNLTYAFADKAMEERTTVSLDSNQIQKKT